MAKRGLHGNWTWAEDYSGVITEENRKAAYSLSSVKIHKPHSCRRNCKTNPTCLSGFGEANWKDPIDIDTEKSDARTPGSYVGLKNLGNTCYVNSLLQLWFHSLPLREAVYLWNAFEDRYELEKHLEVFGKEPDRVAYQPQSSVAHLQLLFAEMEFGKSSYCDPGDFCHSLSLDVELQQDAQEFSKLYMHRMEETFATATNEKTRNVIQEQFRGEYSYVTICSKCKHECRHDSFFYELELRIKGFKTIQESLSGFIGDELLAGENKYLCSVCNSKEDAVRRIKLNALPPYLQLQMIRYFYDMNTATKKKISQPIEFPDVLDMSPYLGLPNKTCLYTLHAVLMHGGPSANKGHYYSHIKTANGWHQFDDTTVKKQKRLTIVTDDQIGKTTAEKKVGKIKGAWSSGSAYMLVYTRLNNGDELSESSPPNSLANSVVNTEKRKVSPRLLEAENTINRTSFNSDHNDIPEQKIADSTKMDLDSCVSINNLQGSMKSNGDVADNIRKLSVDEKISENNFEYPEERLGKYNSIKLESTHSLTTDKCMEMTNSKNEERVHINNSKDSIEESQEVFDGYKSDDENRRGAGDAPCSIVTDLQKRHWELLPEYLKLHIARLNEDYALSMQIELHDIGIKNQHQAFVKDFCEDVCPTTPLDLNQCEFVHYESLANLAKSCDVAPLDNKPLLCPHECLDFESLKYFKLVKKEAVEKYIKAFGGGPRIAGSQLCEQCVSSRAEKVRARAILKTDIKSVINLLKAPILEGEQGFWVGKKSLKFWWLPIERGFGEPEIVASTEDSKPETESVTGVFNSDITCPHDGLSIGTEDKKLVPSAAWDILTKYFPNCKEIDNNTLPCLDCENARDMGKINELQLREKANQERELFPVLYSENQDIINDDGLCFLVSSAFVSAWRRYIRSANLTVLRERPTSDLMFEPIFCGPHSLLVYDPNFDTDRFFFIQATEWETLRTLYNVEQEIFVSKQEDGSLEISVELCSECIANRISNDEFKTLEESYHRARLEVYKVSNEVEEEPMTTVSNVEAKKTVPSRKRKSDTEITLPLAKKSSFEQVRRSARSRQPKGERETFNVDKNTTLKDFKVMICAKMSVMPCDQHLYLENGEDLDDLQTMNTLSNEEATLLRLGVPPNSILRLVADEPKADDDFLTEPDGDEPETGFKGTELGGR